MKNMIDLCNNPIFQRAMLNSDGLLILFLDKGGDVRFLNEAGARLLGYKVEEAIGKNWFDHFVPDELKKRIFAVFSNIIKGRIKKFRVFENDVIGKNGIIKTISFTNSLVREGKRIIGVLSVGIDITEYAKADKELKRLKEVNEILIKTSFELNQTDDVERISDIVVRAAKRITDSKYGYAGYIDEDTGYFFIPRFSREIMNECKIRNKNVVFKEYSGLWGWSIKNKKVVLSNDVKHDVRSQGIPKGHIEIKKFLALPVINNTKVIGQIAVANSSRDYTENDVFTLNRLINLYNLALSRIRYQSSLKDILKKFTISLEISNQIVYSYNIDTGKISFEGNTKRVMGYEVEVLPDNIEGILDLIHPDDRDRFIKFFNKSRDYVEFQVRFKRQDGDYMYIQIKGFLIKDKRSGEKIKYGMISDISSIVKYETEILQREEEIKLIIENMPLPVVVMDKFKNIIFLNKSFVSLYGYSKDDMVDFDEWVKRAFPFATSEELVSYSRLVFEEQMGIDENDNIVAKMLSKNGNLFYVKFYKRNIGKNIIIILEDITEDRIRQKRIDFINALLKINTDINREVTDAGSAQSVFMKVIEILFKYNLFKFVYSYTFEEGISRRLVFVDVNGVRPVDNDKLPYCVSESISRKERVIYDFRYEDCVKCGNFNFLKDDEKVVIISIKEGNVFYGNLILNIKNGILISDEVIKIFEGISKDISMKIENIFLQKQNKEFIDRIKNLARFPTENPNPLVRIDRNGILLYANPASVDLVNFWKTSLGSVVPTSIKNDIDYSFEIEKNVEREYKINERCYSALIVPFPDTAYANIYFVDITEKREKEIALKESEERFRKLFDEAPVGYYLQSEDGVFIDGNATLEALIGYKKEELIGKNFIECGLIAEDKVGQAVEFFRKSICENVSGPFEIEVVRKDGKKLTLQIYVRFIEIGGKKTILGIVTDISDRVRLQNEIIKANKELARLSENLREEVERQTEQIRRSESLAILVKNIIIIATNLYDISEIVKESASYIVEFMNYLAFGYYLYGEYNSQHGFFLCKNSNRCGFDVEVFDDSLLKKISKDWASLNEAKVVDSGYFEFYPDLAREFDKNNLSLLLLPIVFNKINIGLIMFLITRDKYVDEQLLDSFSQISIQLGTIIEQKKSELKREKISKLYESVLSSAGDGIIGTDDRLNITFVNRSAQKILGYGEGEVLGSNIHNLLHTDENGEMHSENECPFKLSLSFSKRIEGENVLFIRSGGDKIHVHNIVTPIVEGNKCVGIVVVFRDITDEKRRQDEINRLATALGQYPIPIGFIDRNGDIKYVNEAFVSHTGLSREELTHMNIEELNRGITYLIKKAPPRTSIFKQYSFTRHDGSKVYEAVTISPIINSFDEVSDYVVIKEDITRHIEIQEAHRVAKEDAERASRAKSAFLATMSHEMRTPLAGIVRSIEEFGETELSDRQRQILKKAKTASDHLMSIINDVLDYSKIESGRMDIENIGFDLYDSLEKVKSITSIKAEEKGLEFKFEVEENIPRYLRGDPKRLQQVLINLISNACKFTYKGGVYVNVSNKAVSNGKVVLLFSVQDTGIGIKDEDKIRIFTPFTQVDSSISRRFGGTGLGLAISKYFVEKMGGDIWVDSEFGKGSTFYFTAEFEVITEDQVEIEEKFVPVPLMLKGARVLLVEDNDLNQELTANLLKKYGAEVEFASNGREAVDMVFARPPDYYNFVLMDIQMPIMDGKTATKIIYEKESYKSLPIIAMTAHVFKDEIEEMLSIGLVAHIPKPFDESLALKTISKFYFNRSAQTECCVENRSIQLPDYLLAIKGIDLVDGLRKTSNDVDTYIKMLCSFRERYKVADVEILELINKGKFKEAEMIVHTIKGVSGNLGIKGVYEKSVYLDNILKTDSSMREIKDAFELFQRELKNAIEEMAKLQGDKRKDLQYVSKDVFDERLNELKMALKGGDVDAIKIFDIVEGNLVDLMGRDNVDKMRDMIENFAYNEALELLKSTLGGNK
ncbi:MAG: PAS domain S-box protein [Deltaproteobacteria bacterium]|nr:PAS domain S-box protein [Deltaproteobacteria bacterium]